jgi:two-component system, OmpR family, phosphate regulon sensor histidine kinase PhoR
MTADTTKLLQALPDGALLVDASGKVTSANATAIDILQINPTGLPVTSVVRTPHFAAAFSNARQTGSLVAVDAEIRSTPARQLNILISTLTGSGETLILLRDFTREQAVEKMRSDFVANASHEMRTPLAAIIGSIETMQGAAKNDPKARDQFLQMMLAQAGRMKRLIDDLLTLSRIELNEHVRPNARVSLNDVAKQAISNLSEPAKAASVSVALQATSEIVVAGDADELLQVAQNLLENAIKYGASGQRIEIECYSHGGQGCLAVRDFGKGIAEFHLPRLTERFYRVNTQESRARGGTGLGLAIVKHIVLRHRGKLSVISRESEGSTFTVSIPLKES